ncbi:uncharacterized protein OCT59_014807 [Rhizophagus irregularis]|uniref:uncharacterized protein n=1 Tax=Rhizophagus irregularis TaxID=588596 RepID=UPI0033173647|nr:hypothetical protein OCT59_014807 [Rhizophagus irregularis]
MKSHPLSRNLRRNCFLIKSMQMKILIDCGLDTSYFLEFPPRDIIWSKAQQHASVSVEVSSNISDHSDRTVHHLLMMLYQKIKNTTGTS